MKIIKIGHNSVGHNQPTYFIADIAANHDGDLERGKKLISLAKKAGANAVKFQHHDVSKYVSDYGFKSLGGKFSHQTEWKKTIYEVYKDAEVPLNWTDELKQHCDEIGIDFFSTPYDLDMVAFLANYVPAFKIGSGDLAWHAMLEKVARQNKPVMIATGAGSIQEVQEAVSIIHGINDEIILMQCNTNYTGDNENLRFINLNVLKTYGLMFPETVLGLSDHTKGHETVLGAISLGAKVVEKHFTDDCKRNGPDHPFSMDPSSWKEMVVASRKLELALGHATKEVQDNEKETVILQRRAIRTVIQVNEGQVLNDKCVQFQRPCPLDALSVNDVDQLLGKKLIKTITSGDYLRKEHFKW
jgi:sialic acid synthase SpsE